MSIEQPQAVVRVQLTTGDSEEVVGDAFGSYVVHLQVTHMNGNGLGPGWSVTHLMSGILIWKTQTYEEACAVARWLRDTQPLPAEATAGELIALPEPVRREVGLRMQEIAPRWDGKKVQVQPL